jgi:phospholipid/cholesterol/gamma-HCH transport system substrate-binding protein
MSNKNFAVGIFVSLALFAFVAATMWLTGRQGSEPTVHYSMFFEKDVGGLMLGGPVFYLGVEVGTVRSMDIIPGNPMRVRVNAEVLRSAPVDAGTYASLAFQGITGVAVIKLNAEPGEHEALRTDSDSHFPEIPVRDVGFSALLAKAPAIIDKLDSVLVQVGHVLGEDNRQLVTSVLEDISGITSELATQKKTIGELPVLLKKTAEELNNGLSQIRSMAGNMEPGLLTVIANLEQTSQNLANMTSRLDTWAATNDADMNGFMQDGLGQIPELVTDARVTLREIEKLVKELREDPSQLIYKPNQEAIDLEK